MPYLGWTEIYLGFCAQFCGTEKMFRTLALVVSNSRSAADYQLIVGTNAGVFRDCYAAVKTKRASCYAVCDTIFEDIKHVWRTGPNGIIGNVKLRSKKRVVLPAGSTQQVTGEIKNKYGKEGNRNIKFICTK